jgi:hypothetical protein
VIITGTNFTGATAVMFGAVAATTFTVNSATQITATSPAGTGTANVTVTTPDGTSAGSPFTYAVPAYFGIFGLMGPPPDPNFMALGGTPDAALIQVISTSPHGGQVAAPASGLQMTVLQVPGHFGYMFAYPDSLPAAASIINNQTSINVLGGASTTTLTINGVSYRVYWSRPTAPWTANAPGHTLTIG